jgi:hypothetical protein
MSLSDMDDDDYSGCCCMGCIHGLEKQGRLADMRTAIQLRKGHPVFGPRDKAAAEERQKAAERRAAA